MINIHKVLSTGLYLRYQIDDKFPFSGHVPFSSLFREFTTAEEMTTAIMTTGGYVITPNGGIQHKVTLC
jgi:hypothetical protein